MSLRPPMITLAAAVALNLAAVSQTHAAPPAPTAVQASDRPWDKGDRIDVRWTMPDDGVHPVEHFELAFQRILAPSEIENIRKQLREVRDDAIADGKGQAEADKAFEAAVQARCDELAPRGPSPGDQAESSVRSSTVTGLAAGGQYLILVRAVDAQGEASPWVSTTAPVTAAKNLFDGEKVWLALMVVVLCASVLLYVQLARMGRKMWVRPIAALQAVDEAVGRATEMGRPCLFVPGVQDVDDMGTIAGISVLGRISRTVAEYGAEMEVPTARGLSMTACREAVQAAYYQAGRPDAYDADKITYITDEQFGFVAYLVGSMVRRKPAACFYMGTFYAESLLLAETGNSIGAIQIAGTRETSQLPFFVAACDYTLIGEEFFAASAYLSGQPDQLGSLKGQDLGKAILGTIIIVGCVMASVAAFMPADSWLDRAVFYVQNVVLK